MAHIIIVDDSPTDVRVLTTLLEKAGHKVGSAGNAEDGIAMVRREKPDLVLMDVIMPGTNGFQATRTLSKDPETASIPILIVTTKSMETDRVWGLRQGAKDFLTKPVAEQDLLARIQHFLLIGGGGARILNELGAHIFCVALHPLHALKDADPDHRQQRDGDDQEQPAAQSPARIAYRRLHGVVRIIWGGVFHRHPLLRAGQAGPTAP